MGSLHRRPVSARSRKAQRKGSILDGVPENLPPLSRAYQLTRKASKFGFDWSDIGGILSKLDEELKELKEALLAQDRNRVREEVGDLLFVLANIARFLHINPERALGKTVQKFISRFRYIERTLRKEGRTLSQSNLVEMDRLWEEAKKKRTRLKG